MKKYFLIVMYAVILCFCCACQGQTKKSAAVPPINCEYGMRNFAVSGDEGYYFFCNNLFIFWDGNPEHAAMPICGRPDCSHDQLKCPAYIGTRQEAKIFYDNGSLYVFSGEKQHDPVTLLLLSVYAVWIVTEKQPVNLNQADRQYKAYIEAYKGLVTQKTMDGILAELYDGHPGHVRI